jgi:hypothetical protein
MITIVYAPTINSQKQELRDYLVHFKGSVSKPWLLVTVKSGLSSMCGLSLPLHQSANSFSFYGLWKGVDPFKARVFCWFWHVKSLWNTSSEALENLGKIHRLVGFILVLSMKYVITHFLLIFQFIIFFSLKKNKIQINQKILLKNITVKRGCQNT